MSLDLPSSSYTSVLKRAAAKKRKESFHRGQLLKQFRNELAKAGLAETKPKPNRMKRVRDDKAADMVGQEEKSRGKKRATKCDPFSKEKKGGLAAREARAGASAKKEEQRRERGTKLNKRKKKARSYQKRDSQGRPLIRNSIGRILDKLQRDEDKTYSRHA